MQTCSERQAEPSPDDSRCIGDADASTSARAAEHRALAARARRLSRPAGCARPPSSTTTASAIERERREQADQAVVDLLQELLLVVDDFDRALTVEAGDEGGAYRKGVELIHAKLHDLLRKQGVQADRRRSAPTSIRTSTRR